MPADTLEVDVCIGTYLRPSGLEQLLLSLAAQRFDAAQAPAPDLRIIVVDNDPDGSALAVVEDVRRRIDLEIHWYLEVERGISHVRNRAVRETRASTDWIAFLDDDEQASPGWLDQLLVVGRATGAAAVAGPVLPTFDAEVPAWVAAAGLHDRARRLTGTAIPYTGTGNVIIRPEHLRGASPPFDPRLALTGGEDTLFFMRLSRSGERIVWCDEAHVHERVPCSRATVGWMLRRAYRGGNTFARCEAIAAGGEHPARRRVNRGLRGCLRIARGTVRMIAAPVWGGRAGAMRGARVAADGVGVLTGLLGASYREYARVHGD